MSKASDWVEMNRRMKPEPLTVAVSGNRILEWSLTEKGHLYVGTQDSVNNVSPALSVFFSVDPPDVQRIIAWILDTFGETDERLGDD